MSIDKELLKGSTATMVLKVIAEGDAYGYEIAAELARRSNGVFRLKEGTLYPILHTLEREKYVTSYLGTAANGRERRYYHLSASGAVYLAARIEEWELFASSVRRVLAGGGAHE